MNGPYTKTLMLINCQMQWLKPVIHSDTATFSYLTSSRGFSSDFDLFKDVFSISSSASST